MVDRVCEQCGQQFQAYPSVVAKGKGKLCSKACYTATQTRAIKRPGKQERRCQECADPFYTYPASPARFCRRACRSAFDARPEEIARRFWSFYIRDGDCLIWTGGNTNAGYGKFSFTWNRKPITVSAHRMAWALYTNAPIPEGMNVCHRCDVRLCGDRLHLFLGTQGDNIRDMFSKRRNSFHLPDGSFWTPKE